MKIMVSVVEDDPRIRESLALLINRAADFSCVSSYPDAETALAEIPRQPPDVVLMDINLPRMSGIECVRALKASLPKLQIVMLTVYDDAELLFKSLMAGATGYLLKRTNSKKLLAAIAEVHKGGAPMTRQIARKVVQYFQQLGGGSPEMGCLTKRELETLSRLAEGYRYKEIADLMEISLDTVREHVRSIYEKLHVTSRTEAVVKYLRY